MTITTITNVMRRWEDEFNDAPFQEVYKNSELIWMIFDKKTTMILQKSWVLDQIREELWEADDKTTKNMILEYNKWKQSWSIWLDEFWKKHEI